MCNTVNNSQTCGTSLGFFTGSWDRCILLDGRFSIEVIKTWVSLSWPQVDVSVSGSSLELIYCTTVARHRGQEVMGSAELQQLLHNVENCLCTSGWGLWPHLFESLYQCTAGLGASGNQARCPKHLCIKTDATGPGRGRSGFLSGWC